MKQAFLRGASAAVVTIAALGTTQAMAQAAPGAAAAGQGGATVTVIAQRRSQAIEKVPVAVTAFTARQRDVLGIQNTQELSDFTPGLSYFSSNDRAYIRGIGRNTVNLGTESGVATYYNGIYYGANASIAEQHDTLFISQIEVDRGPQNTLHGSNADGGTINYISAKPTNTYYAEGRVGVANYNEWYGEGVVSGPITDWLRFRAGGNYEEENGGFYDNLVGKAEGGNLPQGNNGKQEYAELQLDANLGPHLDAWGIISTGDYDTSFHTTAPIGVIGNYELPNASLSPSGFYGLCALPGQAGNVGCSPAFTGQVVVPGSVVTDPVNASMFPGNNPANVNLHKFIQDYTDSNRQTRDLAMATRWTYHFPGVDVQYLGGYQQFYYDLGVSGNGFDAGVQSYQLAGLPAAVATLACPGFALFCEAPLTINPAQEHTTFVEDEQYFSHELTATSTAPGPVQWIAGAYWYHQHFNQPVNLGCLPEQTQLLHPAALPIPGAGPNIIDPQMCEYDLDSHTTYNSYAGFGQVTWQFDPQWKLEAAARYTDDQKSGVEEHRVIGFDQVLLGLPYLGAVTPAVDITPLAISFAHSPGVGLPYENLSTGFWERNFSASWGAWTGEITLNWQPDSDTLGYAKYSRGYKTGGFNSGFIAANPETAPEYVDAFEVGAKKLFGSMFQINGAAFYYNYQNDQQPLNVQDAATGTISSLIFNIPTVHSYGVELEAIWRPIDQLQLTAQYSYLNATVASMDGKCVENTLDPLGVLAGSKHGTCPLSAGAQLVDLTGSHLPETPPNKISLNALYTFTFDPGKLVLSASVIWKDKTYGSIFNNPQSLAGSYSTVNLRAEWDDAQNRYNISAFVDNVFNTTGYDIVTGTQLAASPATAAQYDIISVKSLTFPLTFGAELQVRFH